MQFHLSSKTSSKFHLGVFTPALEFLYNLHVDREQGYFSLEVKRRQSFILVFSHPPWSFLGLFFTSLADVRLGRSAGLRGRSAGLHDTLYNLHVGREEGRRLPPIGAGRHDGSTFPRGDGRGGEV